MQRDYGPIIRIVLRYIAGGAFMGSVAFGEKLATDPDLIYVASMLLAAGVESYYAYAKKKGKAL